MNQKQAVELLDRYIRARYPIVAIASHEESRVLEAIKSLSKARNRKLAEWSYTEGLKADGVEPMETMDPIPALDQIVKYPITDPDDSKAMPTIFVMKDLHPMLTDPKIIRYMRDVAAKFETCKHSLILLSPSISIPSELEKTIVVIDWPLPDSDELAGILHQAEVDLPGSIPNKLNGNREMVVQALRGLTQFEAGSVILSAIVATREFSDGMVPFIVKEKAQIIRKSGVLEYYDQTVTMDQVGGLKHFKTYAEIKRTAFSVEARAAGVDAPKGVLLVGVPGTGKSLVAKAMAGGKMPLLRMDFGALLAGLVGKSEENLRLALKVAEATSPCVLWIDEIEKALGGGGELDGGTAVRMLGSLLTWMQETTAPVYVFATANNVQSLKPELLRRFDDILFVDLPCRSDRLQVINVHLAKRKREVKSTGQQWEALLDATWGFSGAEIEKIVKSAIERTFAAKTDLTMSDLLDASNSIVPISVTMADQITNLRAWATTRAIPASDPLEQKPVTKSTGKSNRKVDLQ